MGKRMKLHIFYPPNIKEGFPRSGLIDMFRDLGFKKGAEIGVSDGQFSLEMCEKIPGLELLCVDPYLKYRESRRKDTQDEKDAAIALATKRMAPYNARFIRKFSMEAVREVPPFSLDFVYIDGNHSFNFVMQDIIEWTKRVRYGGIVSGHDYDLAEKKHHSWVGVGEAVNMYTKYNHIEEWYLLKNGRDVSFYWVRENRWRKSE